MSNVLRQLVSWWHRPADRRLDYCRCGGSWPCYVRRQLDPWRYENAEYEPPLGDEPVEVIDYQRRWSMILFEVNQDRFGFCLCIRLGPRRPFPMFDSDYLFPLYGFTVDWHSYYGEPDRITLGFKRYSVVVALNDKSGSQLWDRRKNEWSDQYGRISIVPNDHRERWQRTHHGENPYDSQT